MILKLKEFNFEISYDMAEELYDKLSKFFGPEAVEDLQEIGFDEFLLNLDKIEEN